MGSVAVVVAVEVAAGDEGEVATCPWEMYRSKRCRSGLVTLGNWEWYVSLFSVPLFAKA